MSPHRCSHTGSLRPLGRSLFPRGVMTWKDGTEGIGMTRKDPGYLRRIRDVLEGFVVLDLTLWNREDACFGEIIVLDGR